MTPSYATNRLSFFMTVQEVNKQNIKIKTIDNALTIPIEAIHQEGNQSYVLVKDNNNLLIKKDIKTGIETDTTIEILEGLSENDQIVIAK